MSQSLVSRWNATYRPGTPVTVSPPGRPQFDAITTGEAFADHDAVMVPVERKPTVTTQPSPVTFPLDQVEHRVILDSATTQAMLGVGMPPLAELEDDAAELVNLRDIPRDRWPEFEGHWLVIPDAIAGYIAKLTAPPTNDGTRRTDQTDHIERHIAEFHSLPPVTWHDGLPWLADGAKAEWYVHFTFAHCFITGTAQLCRNH